MTPDDEDRVTGEAVRFLAESLLEVGGKAETLAGQVRRGKRVIHWLIGAVAVLALLVAGVTTGFLFAFHQQDMSRANARQARDAQIARVEAHLAVVQAQNTRFREAFCKMDKSLRVYLAQAPAGDAAGQAAARDLIAALTILCPK